MNCLYQTKRISDLKEKMLSSKRYASIEQARIITRVYQENEKLSLPKKRALSLKAANGVNLRNYAFFKLALFLLL